MTNSEFGSINRKDAAFFIVLAIGCGILFSFSAFHTLLAIIIIGLLLYQAYKNPFNCWGTYIITQRYISQLFSSYVSVAIFGVLFLSFIIRKPSMLRKLRDGIILLIGLPLIVLSIYVGYQSNETTGLYMAIILVTIIAILNYSDIATREDLAKVAFSYCCGAVSVALYFAVSMATHTNILKYGRLSFFGDIKPIAFATFIPLFFILSSKLEGKRCFENIDSKILDAVLIAVYAAVIILTAARGMIFAGIIALGIQALFSRNQVKAIWKLIPVILFVAILIFYTMASNDLRIARIFNFQSSEFETLNGRTTAWKEYFEIFKEGNLLHKIVGFGPGDGGRLVSSGLYTHSTYLDYLISYGVIGFITMLYYEVKAGVKLMRGKDLVLLVVFLFSVIAEMTHGNSANFVLLSLHAFLILCLSSNNNTRNIREKY